MFAFFRFKVIQYFLMEFTTKRLNIRPIRIEDKNALYEYRSDPETYKYLSFVPTEVKDVEEFIHRCSKDFNIQGTWFQFVLLLKGSQALIGDVGVHFLDTESENKQVEIGYTLNPAFRNNGYANEALTEIIDYLFTSLKKHRVTASVDPSNISSIRLLEKLGFRKEAHFKKSLFFHGKWVDDVVFALLSEEWTK